MSQLGQERRFDRLLITSGVQPKTGHIAALLELTLCAIAALRMTTRSPRRRSQ
jgi:hypothetical protein